MVNSLYYSLVHYGFLISSSSFYNPANIKNPKLINFISYFSPLTFGVYLIHDNINLRGVLWKQLNTASTANEPQFLIYLLLLVFLIFICCSLIDKLRMFLFGYLDKITVDKVESNPFNKS